MSKTFTKQLKKVVTVALCATMAFSFAGCKKQTAEDANLTKITVWSGNGHDKIFMDEEVKLWNDTIGKEKGIVIDYIVKSGDLSEQIALAMENGTAPDLFTSCDDVKLAAQGKIAPLDDIKGIQPIIEKYKDFMMPSRCQIDGKTYIIPKSCTTYGLIYNVEMFKKAGIVDENGNAKPPKTLAELREDAKILTNPDKKEYGIIFPGKWSDWYGCDVAKMAVPSCGYISGYNPKTGTYDYSALAPVMKTIVGIKKDGSYYPGVEGLDNDPARARFAEGGIGMKTAGSFDYGVLTEQFPAKIEWAVAPFPVANENEMYKQHMDISGSLYINANSLEKFGEDKICAVYDFFYSDDLVKKSYARGLAIPLDMKMVEGTEVDKSLKNGNCWTQFCELTNVSKPSPMGIKTDMTGFTYLSVNFVNDIWTNAVSDEVIDKYVADYTKTVNDGIKRYKDLYPDYDAKAQGCIVPDWDASR